MKKTNGLNIRTKKQNSDISLRQLFESSDIVNHFIKHWYGGSKRLILVHTAFKFKPSTFFAKFDEIAQRLEVGEQVEYGKTMTHGVKGGILMVERWHDGKLIATYFGRTQPYDKWFMQSHLKF